jgi:hypothetical protein
MTPFKTGCILEGFKEHIKEKYKPFICKPMSMQNTLELKEIVCELCAWAGRLGLDELRDATVSVQQKGKAHHISVVLSNVVKYDDGDSINALDRIEIRFRR